jgi:hypothetical protein
VQVQALQGAGRPRRGQQGTRTWQVQEQVLLLQRPEQMQRWTRQGMRHVQKKGRERACFEREHQTQIQPLKLLPLHRGQSKDSQKQTGTTTGSTMAQNEESIVPNVQRVPTRKQSHNSGGSSRSE